MSKERWAHRGSFDSEEPVHRASPVPGKQGLTMQLSQEQSEQLPGPTTVFRDPRDATPPDPAFGEAIFGPAFGAKEPSATGMPATVQAKMERAFGADFSTVRIRPNSSKATALGALAATEGEEVHFAPGEFQPETQTGQTLLGHELTHVIQQRQGRVRGLQRKGTTLNVDPALEAEADDLGARAALGEQVTPGDSRGSGGLVGGAVAMRDTGPARGLVTQCKGKGKGKEKGKEKDDSTGENAQNAPDTLRSSDSAEVRDTRLEDFFRERDQLFFQQSKGAVVARERVDGLLNEARILDKTRDLSPRDRDRLREAQRWLRALKKHIESTAAPSSNGGPHVMNFAELAAKKNDGGRRLEPFSGAGHRLGGRKSYDEVWRGSEPPVLRPDVASKVPATARPNATPARPRVRGLDSIEKRGDHGSRGPRYVEVGSGDSTVVLLEEGASNGETATATGAVMLFPASEEAAEVLLRNYIERKARPILDKALSQSHRLREVYERDKQEADERLNPEDARLVHARARSHARHLGRATALPVVCERAYAALRKEPWFEQMIEILADERPGLHLRRLVKRARKKTPRSRASRVMRDHKEEILAAISKAMRHDAGRADNDVSSAEHIAVDAASDAMLANTMENRAIQVDRDIDDGGGMKSVFRFLSPLIAGAIPEDGDATSFDVHARIPIHIPSTPVQAFIGVKLAGLAEHSGGLDFDDGEIIRITAKLSLTGGAQIPEVFKLFLEGGVSVLSSAPSAELALTQISYALFRRLHDSKLSPRYLSAFLWGFGRSSGQAKSDPHRLEGNAHYRAKANDFGRAVEAAMAKSWAEGHAAFVTLQGFAGIHGGGGGEKDKRALGGEAGATYFDGRMYRPMFHPPDQGGAQPLADSLMRQITIVDAVYDRAEKGHWVYNADGQALGVVRPSRSFSIGFIETGYGDGHEPDFVDIGTVASEAELWDAIADAVGDEFLEDARDMRDDQPSEGNAAEVSGELEQGQSGPSLAQWNTEEPDRSDPRNWNMPYQERPRFGVGKLRFGPKQILKGQTTRGIAGNVGFNIGVGVAGGGAAGQVQLRYVGRAHTGDRRSHVESGQWILTGAVSLSASVMGPAAAPALIASQLLNIHDTYRRFAAIARDDDHESNANMAAEFFAAAASVSERIAVDCLAATIGTAGLDVTLSWDVRLGGPGARGGVSITLSTKRDVEMVKIPGVVDVNLSHGKTVCTLRVNDREYWVKGDDGKWRIGDLVRQNLTDVVGGASGLPLSRWLEKGSDEEVILVDRVYDAIERGHWVYDQHERPLGVVKGPGSFTPDIDCGNGDGHKEDLVEICGVSPNGDLWDAIIDVLRPDGPEARAGGLPPFRWFKAGSNEWVALVDRVYDRSEKGHWVYNQHGCALGVIKGPRSFTPFIDCGYGEKHKKDLEEIRKASPEELWKAIVNAMRPDSRRKDGAGAPPDSRTESGVRSSTLAPEDAEASSSAAGAMGQAFVVGLVNEIIRLDYREKLRESPRFRNLRRAVEAVARGAEVEASWIDQIVLELTYRLGNDVVESRDELRIRDELLSQLTQT